jgi:iron(III) transport system permease protein
VTVGLKPARTAPRGSITSDVAPAAPTWHALVARIQWSRALGSLIMPASAIILLFMVLAPFGWLLWMSVHSDDTGLFTLQNYADAFAPGSSLDAIVNTLVLAASVASIATVAGTLLAWLTARTDMPLAPLVRSLTLAGFVTPSFLGGLAWTILASPHAGWLNVLWIGLTGATAPLVNIFTLGGAIFVMAIYAISYPYSLVAAALEQAPSEYENAARTLGAGLPRITWTVTIPLAMPAILSGFILAFLEALGAFGVPAFLLIPARVPVISIHLFSFFAQFPPSVGEAAAFGMPVLLVSAVLLVVQRRLLGKRRHTLITGKAGRTQRASLGAWRWPALAVAMIAPILAVVLPYAAMLLVSLMAAWGRGPFAPHNLTLHWYYLALFQSSETSNALWHSLTYCSAAATIAVAVATLVAYGRARGTMRGGNVIGFVALSPFAVPGVVLAIGLYAAYSHPPIRLVGTAWVMIVAFATQFLPIAYTSAIAMFGALNVDLENAARILGASRMRVLVNISAPLLRGFILASWLLIFITSFRELSTAIFLFVGETSVITTAIFDYSASGPYQPLFVLGILMMLIVFAMSAAVHRLFGGRSELSSFN